MTNPCTPSAGVHSLAGLPQIRPVGILLLALPETRIFRTVDLSLAILVDDREQPLPTRFLSVPFGPGDAFVIVRVASPAETVEGVGLGLLASAN